MSKDAARKRRMTMSRTYRASVEDVWELWTTKAGIESWWGPEGFEVRVHTLDLRPGGGLVYSMTAVGAAQVGFMKNAGMPLTTTSRLTYTEVVARKRLSFTLRADFIPGVEPYDVATTVELRPAGSSVRMTLRFDAMHDAEWTQRMRMGREGELGRLGRLLAGGWTAARTKA